MKTLILRHVLSATLLLCLGACGGGGSGTGTDPSGNTPPDGNPPDNNAPELEIIGKLPYLGTDGELKLVVGDKEFAGEILADGDYRVSAPVKAFEDAALARVEAVDGSTRMIIPLADANTLPGLAGEDSRLLDSELTQVNFSEFAAASYAVLVNANAGEHIVSTAALLKAQRDQLNGDIALQLAAALRLSARDGYALPAGVDDSWQMMLDHSAAAGFLNKVREAELAFGQASGAFKILNVAAEDDIIAATVEEIVTETAETVPYEPLPEGASIFYRATTISRNLDDQTGFFAILDADGTGVIDNEGGRDTLTWVIDPAGRIVVTPENGMPITEQGVEVTEAGEVVYQVSTLIEQLVFTRLQSTPLNDLLYVETVRRQRYENPEHQHLNDGIEPVTSLRSMIAVKPGGQLTWSEDEPVGLWALPGVLFSDFQVNVAGVPVKTDDLYEFRIDENGVGRGEALLSGEEFTWQFREEFGTGRRIGVDLNWISNGSGLTFSKVRADGGAFDVINAAAVLEGDETVKYASGSLAVKHDASFLFNEDNAPGSYLLYGAVEPLSGEFGRFTMFVRPDHRVTFESLDDDGVLVPVNERRWDVDDEGRLIVSLRQDVSLSGGFPVKGEVNPDCVDPDACFTAHERIEHPMQRDGDHLYVLEEQIFYEFDPAQPFGKGEISVHQKHIRYWEIGTLPEQ